MQRLKLMLALTALFCLAGILVVAAQPAFTVDATKQQTMMRPARASGPFPGSATPGHSYGFPIRLEIEFPTTKVPSQGSVLVNFILTNVGTEPVQLPCSAILLTDPNIEGTSILNLWITSDAIVDQYAIDAQTGRPFKISIVGISAELDGIRTDPMTFCTLEPGQALQVHANSRVTLKMGTHSFTAHAELIPYSTGIRRPETADSKPVSKTLSMARPVPQ